MVSKALLKSTMRSDPEMFFDSAYEMILLIKQMFSAMEHPFKKPSWSLSTKFAKTALGQKANSLGAILWSQVVGEYLLPKGEMQIPPNPPKKRTKFWAIRKTSYKYTLGSGCGDRHLAKGPHQSGRICVKG